MIHNTSKMEIGAKEDLIMEYQSEKIKNEIESKVTDQTDDDQSLKEANESLARDQINRALSLVLHNEEIQSMADILVNIVANRQISDKQECDNG